MVFECVLYIFHKSSQPREKGILSEAVNDEEDKRREGGGGELSSEVLNRFGGDNDCDDGDDDDSYVAQNHFEIRYYLLVALLVPFRTSYT